QAWPEVRNADELHDFLLDVSLLPVEKAAEWESLAQQLIRNGRATTASWPVNDSSVRQAYVAAERCDLVRRCLPAIAFMPPIGRPLGFEEKTSTEEEAFRKIIHGWMEALGPTTVGELSAMLGLPSHQIEIALIGLETEGVVLRGQFRNARETATEVEWCER